jgi:ribosomal protein S27AE
MADQKTEIVAQATQAIEATQIQMQLDACGIDSRLDGEMTVVVDPLLSNAIGGIKVLVSTEDAEQAAEVVADYRQREKEAYEAKKRICPTCGDENGHLRKAPVLLGILSILTLGALSLLMSWERYKCPNCGQTWK